MPLAQMLRFHLVLFAAISPTSILSADDPRPNVILLMTDDQGYGEFSCNGNPLIETPHIDQLASESVRFTDFHVSPMCTPTRGQLMSGLDAFRNLAINVSSGRTLMRPELKTMANVFHDAGYRTALFGKWHLGDNYPFRPEDRGFDEAVWFPSSHINSVPDYWNNDYFDDTFIHNTKRQAYPGYCTDVFFNEAMNWIKNGDQQKPFFVYLALNSAHSPWFVPESYREPVRAALAAHPEIVKHLNPQQQKMLTSFLAMGANIDENVGRLDEFLDHSNFNDNTIVVFLTDNGSTMGELYYNAGMKGKKTTLWEGGHRVPCFIRWPAAQLQPREIPDLCHVQDLLPTLADLSDNSEHLPEQLDGVSLKPLIENPSSTLDDRMLVINYSRMPGFKVTYTNDSPVIPKREGACVLWKNWRLLEDRELYDIKSDPHQDKDVAADHPEIVQAMRAHLDQWWDGVKDDVLTPQRVIIGHEKENPLLLSGCEWLDVFIDQQAQVRRGVRNNGNWHVTVAESGKYEFTLRRWPEESGFKLFEGCPELKVTDGKYGPGTAFPIRYATLKIDDQILPIDTMTEDQTAFTITAPLKAGPTVLRSAFLDENRNEICGAYYLIVRRLDQ